MVDVRANHAAGDNGNCDATVPLQRGKTGQAADVTCREQARYEREVAALDLTDAAQAMARALDASVDSSQVDLATALYASADRHRRLAERLESVDGTPGVPGEVP